MLWGSLALLTLAVARGTRIITTDKIALPFRRWIVNKFGEESWAAYWVHCDWCSSIWVAFIASAAWTFALLPSHHWWLGIPAWLAMSYVAGLLSQLEER